MGQEKNTVLVVDDEPGMREFLEIMLKRDGYIVDTAPDGARALDKMENTLFDLAIVDIQMPVMDGYTATREIRRWEKEEGVEGVPIVALTAHALSEELNKCMEAGCTAFITKPVKKMVLIEAISRYARRKDEKCSIIPAV